MMDNDVNEKRIEGELIQGHSSPPRVTVLNKNFSDIISMTVVQILYTCNLQRERTR
jgi:hypothetical protein